MDKNQHIISSRILQWYKINKRELPWRSTKDSYKVWVSEVVLQQTRVSQGTAYYLRFVEAFPTVESLANAQEDTVLKLWQGLGYYSRARNMHAAAKQVLELFNGAFPNNYHDLLSLKGVGPYTAAAVSSITSGEPVAVVDGNVERVLSRLFLVKLPINETQGKKEIKIIAQSILDENNAGDHNQGLMEIGALVCTPKNPNCEECPVQSNCLANKNNCQTDLPLKTKKNKQRKRFFNYYFILHKENIFMKKREPGDIWNGLYETVLIESDSLLEPTDALEILNSKFGLSSHQYLVDGKEMSYKHVLSHQVIYATFISIKMQDNIDFQLSGYEMVSLEKILTLPVSRLTDRFLKENNLLGLEL